MKSMFGIRGMIAAAVIGMAMVGPLYAQEGARGTLMGRVTDEAGGPLEGARVAVTHQNTGLQSGALAEADGRYVVPDLRPGLYRVTVRRIGYDIGLASDVRVSAGESTELNFSIGIAAIPLDAIEVFSTRAIERKTPVAYTNVDKEQLDQQLGSQDMPLVLNVTPSVYATEQGGAAGDARINVRGFDQRNVSVMINGVPVNDMENGWVYWSNWDGVGDATSTIQLQRGLSAVNLATPSIGGTLNVITDATAMSRGGMFKQEFGSDGFIKSTAMLASGLINDKFAFMAQGVRKTGDGVADGIWTDAWAYYVAASWEISQSNRLDLYALGAPQRHGQRLYKQNIGAYSHEFARGLDSYDLAALDDYPESVHGYDYNENWNSVSTDYTGQQAAGSSRFDRHERGFLNERENFFHKPQVNLNWYSSLSPTLSLSTVAYYSGGRGGGTGEIDYFSGFLWDYSGPSRVADWDGMIAINEGTVDRRGDAKVAGRSMGILRNSRNNQWTVGAISKLNKQFSQAFTMELGLDWRTAEIEHYREVRDLLGGNFFITQPGDASDFWPSPDISRGLGDKIDYDFTNTVDWFGGYLQAEYSTDKGTLFGMGGLSTIKYTHTNHFRDDGTGQEIYADPDAVGGFQFKGGGLLNLSDEVGVYLNAGYVSKVPIFDEVVDDFDGVINPDPKNEKFTSIELGLNYRSLNRAFAASLNGYFTQWNDRSNNRIVTDEFGNDVVVSLLGLDQRHMGFEAAIAYQASDFLRLDVATAVSNWKYTDDVSGNIKASPGAEPEPFDFYVKDLKVGDAPQLQGSASVSLFPTEGVFVQLVGRAMGNHYAGFDPFDRTEAGDRVQSWKAPGYAVVDAHFAFTLPESFRLGQRTRLFAHVFNLFDEEYILDAIDNSSFNGFDDDHDADDAEVFFGLPRRVNVGLQFNF